MRETRHRQQSRQEADEDCHRVDQHKLLLLPTGDQDDRDGDHRVNDDASTGVWCWLVVPSLAGSSPGSPFGPSRASALSRPGRPGTRRPRPRAAACCWRVEEPEQGPRRRSLAREVGDLGLIRSWDADVQVDGEGGQPDGQPANDHDRQRERPATELPLAAIAELAELGDRGGRGLFPSPKPSRPGRRAARRSPPGSPIRCRRRPCVLAGSTQPAARTATAAMMKSKVMNAKTSRPPCPNQVSPATNHEHQRQRDPSRGQRRQVGDQGATGRSDRDGDREREVNDQSADCQKRPRLRTPFRPPPGSPLPRERHERAASS